jgi:hypothetical protein
MTFSIDNHNVPDNRNNNISQLDNILLVHQDKKRELVLFCNYSLEI